LDNEWAKQVSKNDLKLETEPATGRLDQEPRRRAMLETELAIVRETKAAIAKPRRTTITATPFLKQ
jgi:hypothetical protein